MKHILLAAAIALCAPLLCAQTAAAQPAVLVKSKPIHGTVPQFSAELPGKALRWIAEETDRQFEAPTSLYDLELAMLLELEGELNSVSKRKKLSFDEVEVLVMHEVVIGAAKKMDKAVHVRRDIVDKAGAPSNQDPELRSLGRRKAGLLKLIQELGPRMTPNTRLLTAASGPDLTNMGARGK